MRSRRRNRSRGSKAPKPSRSDSRTTEAARPAQSEKIKTLKYLTGESILGPVLLALAISSGCYFWRSRIKITRNDEENFVTLRAGTRRRPRLNTKSVAQSKILVKGYLLMGTCICSLPVGLYIFVVFIVLLERPAAEPDGTSPASSRAHGDR